MSKIILTFEFDSLTEAARLLGAMAGNATAVVEKNATPAPTPEKAKAEGKVEKKPASPPAAAASSQPATDAASSASSTEGSKSAGATDAETIPYSDLQKEVFKVAGLGAEPKAKVLAIAAEMGAPTFKELPATRWAEARDRVIALHAELTAEVA